MSSIICRNKRYLPAPYLAAIYTISPQKHIIKLNKFPHHLQIPKPTQTPSKPNPPPNITHIPTLPHPPNLPPNIPLPIFQFQIPNNLPLPNSTLHSPPSTPQPPPLHTSKNRLINNSTILRTRRTNFKRIHYISASSQFLFFKRMRLRTECRCGVFCDREVTPGFAVFVGGGGEGVGVVECAGQVAVFVEEGCWERGVGGWWARRVRGYGDGLRHGVLFDSWVVGAVT